MTDEAKGRWVTTDFCASGVVVNPLNSHYENAVRHLEEVFRQRPPTNHDLLGAPHSCAEVLENMFGRIAQRTGGARRKVDWSTAKLEALGVTVGKRARKLLATLHQFWNRDKHGSREGDAVEAFRTATPEFGVDMLNLTGALLAAYYFKASGVRVEWIRVARVGAGGLELRNATDDDQREMMASWEITAEGF